MNALVCFFVALKDVLLGVVVLGGIIVSQNASAAMLGSVIADTDMEHNVLSAVLGSAIISCIGVYFIFAFLDSAITDPTIFAVTWMLACTVGPPIGAVIIDVNITDAAIACLVGSAIEMCAFGSVVAVYSCTTQYCMQTTTAVEPPESVTLNPEPVPMVQVPTKEGHLVQHPCGTVAVLCECV